MRFGFFGVNAGVLSEPATMVAAATIAEAAGWESIWTGEHLVAAEDIGQAVDALMANVDEGG